MPRFFSILSVMIAVLMAATAQGQTTYDPPALDRAFEAVIGYEAGDGTATLEFVRQYVDRATGRYKIRVDAEARLLGVLGSRQSSAAAKEFAAHQLYRLCDEDTVPAFSKLLLRSDTSDLARKGLERIDHPKAQIALLTAVDKATGSVLIGIIETLGERADPSAVETLRRLAASGNAEVTRAALTALGKTPGVESMEALDWCRTRLTRRMRPYATQAYIQCGWKSLEHGDYETAVELFDSLLIEIEPIEVRAEGLRGLIRAEREKAVPSVISALSSGIPELQAIAAEEAGQVPGREATDAFIKYFPDVTPENRVILLSAFAQRGDEAAISTILLATKSRLPELRLAAIEALGAFNHPDTLQALLKAAASGTGDEQRLARESLKRLDDPRTNDALVKAAMSADNGIRFEAIKSMVTRNATNAVPALLRIAERDVEVIRLEALKALGVLASYNELPFMVEMLVDAWNEESRTYVAQAVVSIAHKSPPGKTRTAALTNALKKGSLSPEVRLNLVYILGEIVDDAGLPSLEAEARKRGGEPQQAALQILAEWPNDNPIATLERVARTTRDPEDRTIAFKGFMRLLRRPSADSTAERTLKYYQQAMKIASSPDEKRMVIEGLSEIKHPDSLKLLERYVEDAQVAQEAAAARERVVEAL